MKRDGRAWLILSLLLGCLQLQAACVPRGGSGPDAEDAKSYTIGKKAFQHLGKMQKHMDAKEYDEAIAELNQMKERKYLNDYERARMHQAFAMVYMAKGDTGKVGESLHEAIKLKAMPAQEQLDTIFNLGQLYLMQEKYKKAHTLLSQWMKKAQNPSPEAHYILATAYAQDKQFKKALPHAKKAIAGMKEEREPWLQFLLSIRFELDQHKEVATLLKRILKSFPEKKQYWLQLSATYAQLEQPDKALATLELAYSQDMLTEEKELLTLARLYIQAGVPFKGAKLIERHLKSGEVSESPEALEVLATSWLLAQERDEAMRMLNKAAKAAKNGELYVQLARLHVEREEWKPAIKALTRGLKKGKLDSAGEAYLLLGIANFNMKKKGAALKAFNKATRHKGSKKAAERWIKIVKGGVPGGGADDEGAEGSQAEADPEAGALQSAAQPAGHRWAFSNAGAVSAVS